MAEMRSVREHERVNMARYSIAMLWLVLAVLMQAAQAVPDLRFHHVHIAVADPAAAMNDAAAHLDGQRLILQGHGPAVRAGGVYLVFDRPEYLLLDRANSSSGSRESDAAASAALDAARGWMRSNGLAVAPHDADAERLIRGTLHETIGIVAFSSDDPRAVVERLRAKGIDPIGTSGDAARYRVSADLTIEIVSETDRPDTHWCPMHPAVRAAGASKCPLCGMEMVPIPPPKVGEYALDVAVTQGTEKGRAVTLRLTVRDPLDGAVVTSFLNVHERSFHLFIVSRDLSTFVHAHPAQRDGGDFALDQVLAPGEYMLIADFLPSGGTPQIVHRAIVTPGYSGPLFKELSKLAVTPAEQTIDGLRVRLETANVTALRPASLRFLVSDAATGAEIRDLEPYLGAAGHLLIVSGNLTSALHGHPADTQTSGPEILFDPVLPKAGLYKLWLQFQRNGRVVTVPFVIEVAPL